jgi:hypothetical protein
VISRILNIMISFTWPTLGIPQRRCCGMSSMRSVLGYFGAFSSSSSQSKTKLQMPGGGYIAHGEHAQACYFPWIGVEIGAIYRRKL